MEAPTRRVETPAASHSPRSGRRRRLIGVSVALLGLALVAGSIPALFLGRRAARVTDLVRPELLPAALARHRADFELAGRALTQVSDNLLPQVAAALGVRPELRAQLITSRYPAIDRVLANRQDIARLAGNSLSNLERRRLQFERADALPLSGVPMIVAPIAGVGVGAALVACGLLVIGHAQARRGRWPLWVAGAIGVGLTLGLLTAQVPGKSADAQAVLRSLDPSQRVVDRTVAFRDQVGQAVAEVEGRVLPDLAEAWAVSPEQLDAAIARSFPELAAARSELPAVLARYDARLHIRVAGAPDLRTLRPLPLEAIAWGSVVFGVLVAALSAFGLAGGAAPRPPHAGFAG